MSSQPHDTVVELSKLFGRALRALGEHGPDARHSASELAAQGWALLNEHYPGAAERMDGVLHYLNGPRFNKPPAAETNPWLPAPPTLQTEAEVDAYFAKIRQDAATGKDFPMEVRHLLPADRHTLIFDVFRLLTPGQGFMLVNDHDPKPLYYQFAFEYADRFTWDPLEEGPDVWRVRIGRR